MTAPVVTSPSWSHAVAAIPAVLREEIDMGSKDEDFEKFLRAEHARQDQRRLEQAQREIEKAQERARKAMEEAAKERAQIDAERERKREELVRQYHADQARKNKK